MELLLNTIFSYFIGLAVNRHSDAIADGSREKLQEQLNRHLASVSKRPLREDLNAACIHLARDHRRAGATPQEESLLLLLHDPLFQNDLYEWLVAGNIVEGREAKSRLQEQMRQALTGANATSAQLEFLEHHFFETLDKAVFADPLLAHWRHQLSLDYLREQVTALRQRAEEAAGHFAPEKQQAALDVYCKKALDAWDIIDLSNLPEDTYLATQKLLLRQLYMPLFIHVEGDGDESLDALEAKREARRRREAGHLPAEESGTEGATRSSVGEILGRSQRLVVLGEPGGGKTTLLRWMATAYLLRYMDDPAFSQLPDTGTLPEQRWIPVLIRCRDLGEADLCRCFNDFLTQHINKTELQPEEARIMQGVILDRIAKGEVLLAVDGLDEIANPRVRMMFCQELERTAARYPGTPIVVTSRIVGYRNMPYRMGAGFAHGVIANLDPEGKDLFAQRWVEVTEQHLPLAEQALRVRELREALHASDRIERLTGNPMLLTTLALVKRKVGKLPTRRTKLYAEAVSVLLNWNPRHYETIDEQEAIPQLEYLAFEMCRRGVQRLGHDEVLDLLDRLRAEYPNIRSIRQRTPEAFLKLLEARSSILIMSGVIWHKETPQGQPAWEFRHLTFQEYLAARALLDGRYPGRNKSQSLAQQVGPLAGQLEKDQPFEGAMGAEEKVSDAWHEALRLLVADCQDDDVDAVLRAILEPMAGEDLTRSARPRAVLAALCLADEPNVSEGVAQRVLKTLAATVGENDGNGLRIRTLVDGAAAEVGKSSWSELLKQVLIQEYCCRPAETRYRPGSLWGAVEAGWKRPSEVGTRKPVEDYMVCLGSTDRVESISAALMIMKLAFIGDLPDDVEGLLDALLDLLEQEDDLPVHQTAAWALVWLTGGPVSGSRRKSMWAANSVDVHRLGRALEAMPESEKDARRWLVHVLGNSSNLEALPFLLARLNDPEHKIRLTVIQSLGQLGSEQAVAALLPLLEQDDHDILWGAAAALTRLGNDRGFSVIQKFLDDNDMERRRSAVKTLARLRGRMEQKLLSRDIDGINPWIDPREPITEERIATVAKRVEKTTQEVRSIYESLAADFLLKFA